MHEKTISSYMLDLRDFSRKVQKVEYIDSHVLIRLSVEDSEKISMQYEDRMKEILIQEKSD